MWRGVVCVEGREQWNSREDEKCMMSVGSYGRYIRVPAGSMAELLQHLQ